MRIADLTVRFGGLEALAGVSLAIAAGEVVGLIGPNGSGKTTLLDAISGLARPAAGTIELDGAPVLGRSPETIARAGIGRCFQTPRLFERMTVLANGRAGQLALPRAARDPDEPRALLDRLGLGPLGDRLAADLTAAERRRLELARALAGRPRLLLLDEPCAGFAKAETEAAMRLLESAAGGRSMLLVEHRMAVVSRLCTRVVVLARGRVVADGPPDAVRRDAAVIEAYLGRAR